MFLLLRRLGVGGLVKLQIRKLVFNFDGPDDAHDFWAKYLAATLLFVS